MGRTYDMDVSIPKMLFEEEYTIDAVENEYAETFCMDYLVLYEFEPRQCPIGATYLLRRRDARSSAVLAHSVSIIRELASPSVN